MSLSSPTQTILHVKCSLFERFINRGRTGFRFYRNNYWFYRRQSAGVVFYLSLMSFRPPVQVQNPVAVHAQVTAGEALDCGCRLAVVVIHTQRLNIKTKGLN